MYNNWINGNYQMKTNTNGQFSLTSIKEKKKKIKDDYQHMKYLSITQHEQYIQQCNKFFLPKNNNIHDIVVLIFPYAGNIDI